jgi:RNA polymerase sigma factor (sigma-70 family)
MKKNDFKNVDPTVTQESAQQVAPKESKMSRLNLLQYAKSKASHTPFSLVSYLNENWTSLSTIVGFKLCRLLSLDHHRLNDLLADTYIKVMDKPSYFTPTGSNINASLVNWLSCIAYRTFLNQQRKSKRQISCDPSILPLLAEEKLNEQNEWDMIIVESQIDSLRKYLHTADEKNIFELIVKGYKHYEIAEQLDMKPNTVHTKISRLTQRLAEAIKDESNE